MILLLFIIAHLHAYYRPFTGITMLTELYVLKLVHVATSSLTANCSCGWAWGFGVLRYGPEWRDGRKAYKSQYNATAVKEYRAGTVYEMNRFLRRTVADPEKWAHYLDL